MVYWGRSAEWIITLCGQRTTTPHSDILAISANLSPHSSLEAMEDSPPRRLFYLWHLVKGTIDDVN